MRAGLVMLMLTALLVLAGLGLYVGMSPGWAQFLWVLASGTAGAGVILIIQHRDDHHG